MPGSIRCRASTPTMPHIRPSLPLRDATPGRHHGRSHDGGLRQSVNAHRRYACGAPGGAGGSGGQWALKLLPGGHVCLLCWNISKDDDVSFSSLRRSMTRIQANRAIRPPATGVACAMASSSGTGHGRCADDLLQTREITGPVTTNLVRARPDAHRSASRGSPDCRAGLAR